MILSAVVLGLCAVTAAMAAIVAFRDSRHRPIAWYLVAILGLDLLRLGLRQLLPPGPTERQGAALLLRHLDQGAYLGLILAVPAMSMALFLRRRPWVIAVVHVAIWTAVVIGYPVLRGVALLRLYTAIELAGGIASAGMFIMWTRSHEGASVPIMSGLVLAAASLATVVVPSLVGEGALVLWPVIVALHGVAFAVVMVLQLRVLLGNSRRSET